MRVYLDTNVYNRPFDDQTQPRISLETQAFVIILQMIESKQVTLVSSTVLEYENSQNPFVLRKRWVNRCLKLADEVQKVDEDIRRRAQQLESLHLKAMDALHLACAEATASDYFLTCDDRIISIYQGELKIITPVDFVMSVITGGNL